MERGNLITFVRLLRRNKITPCNDVKDELFMGVG